MTKKPAGRDITVNRRAFHDYHIDERFEAGLALVGSEVKSLRDGKANLKDCYARFLGDELYLIGAHISPYGPARRDDIDPIRRRKLLLHAREIRKLERELEGTGLTLVPTKVYLKNGRIKVEIAVGRGKKLHDKRDVNRKREAQREIDRAAGAKR